MQACRDAYMHACMQLPHVLGAGAAQAWQWCRNLRAAAGTLAVVPQFHLLMLHMMQIDADPTDVYDVLIDPSESTSCAAAPAAQQRR